MKHRRSVIGVVLLCALSGVAPVALAEEVDKSPLTAAEWQQYRELSKRIKEEYVDPVDDKRLFNACLSGMSHLDPHSDYLDAEALKAMTTGSGIAGIGLELQIRNNRATVISAIEDSPAAKAGIRRGDTLFKIDGDLVSLSPSLPRERGRGQSNRCASFTLKRDLSSLKYGSLA